MTAFAAWILDSCDDPRSVEGVLAAALARRGLTVVDGAIINWPQTRRRPQLRAVENIPRTGALGDAFWGLYFGALFFAPRLTGAIDHDEGGAGPSRTAVTGVTAPTCSLDDGLATIGLANQFSRAMQTGLSPGGAVVVVLCTEGVSDAITAALAPHGSRHTRSPVSQEHLTRLRAMFAR